MRVNYDTLHRLLYLIDESRLVPSEPFDNYLLLIHLRTLLPISYFDCFSPTVDIPIRTWNNFISFLERGVHQCIVHPMCRSCTLNRNIVVFNLVCYKYLGFLKNLKPDLSSCCGG